MSRHISQPALAAAFEFSTKTSIDVPLIGGAVLFGMGSGLAGLCPGPAIASLSIRIPQTVRFTAALVVGLVAIDALVRLRLSLAAWVVGTPQ